RNEVQVLRPPYGFMLKGVWNRRHGGYGVKSSPQEASLIVTVVPASSLRNRGVRLPAVPAVLTTPKMCAVYVVLAAWTPVARTVSSHAVPHPEYNAPVPSAPVGTSTV